MAPGYVSKHMWWARKGWHGNGHVAERGPRLTWSAPTGGIFGKVFSRGMYMSLFPPASCLPIYTPRCWYFLWTVHGGINISVINFSISCTHSSSDVFLHSRTVQVPRREASCNTCTRVPGQRGRFRSRTPTCCNLAPSHFRSSQSAARATASTTSSRAKTFRACFCQSRVRSSFCLWRRNSGVRPRALPTSTSHLPLTGPSPIIVAFRLRPRSSLTGRPITPTHPLS